MEFGYDLATDDVYQAKEWLLNRYLNECRLYGYSLSDTQGGTPPAPVSKRPAVEQLGSRIGSKRLCTDLHRPTSSTLLNMLLQDETRNDQEFHHSVDSSLKTSSQTTYSPTTTSSPPPQQTCPVEVTADVILHEDEEAIINGIYDLLGVNSPPLTELDKAVLFSRGFDLSRYGVA